MPGPAPIHVGIGGWSFAPWRGAFYPPGLPQAQELHYASRHVTAIEINGTFYRTQSPASFAKWAADTPDGFIFAVKASRAATYRTDPDAAAQSVAHFLGSGLVELGAKLGPILWQFPKTRRFDPAAMTAFLDRLPAAQDGVRLRHVIEAAHPSFADPAWIDLLRRAGVAAAIVDRDGAPLADITADFIYARLERNAAAEPDGYAPGGIAAWQARLESWAAGRPVKDLPSAGSAAPGGKVPRPCFAFFISGDKQVAPVGAGSLIGRLG